MSYGIIGFDHYKISCIIGQNPEERLRAQDIYIDLRIEHDFSLPAKHDDFEKTICYDMLATVCEELAINKKYRLLETYAVDLIEALLNQYKIKWAFVKIKKPNAIKKADYAIVELEGGVRS
jgi:dihydroneopterin aldolase